MTKSRVANAMLQDVPWDGNELASPLTLPGALIAPSYVEQSVQTTPATPAGGKVRLYPKPDGKYYTLNASGVETELGSGGGSSYVHPDPFTIGTLTVSTKATLAAPDITGEMSFVPDNTYDIGGGAKRPRDVIIARNQSVGGDATVVGSLITNTVKTPTGTLVLQTQGASPIDFKPNGAVTWSVASDGHFRPTSANGTLDLGAPTTRVRNIYLYNVIDQRQINTPAPPPAGSVRIYPKTNGKLYTLNSAGVETDLTAVGHVVDDPLVLNVGLEVNGYLETESLEFWHDPEPGTRGPRITADMSTAPNSERLMFENSEPNSASYLGIKPSGTGIGGAIIVYEIDDTPNSPYGIIWNDGTQVNMGTGASGAGIPKPLSIWSSGEKWRIPVEGHLLPGTNNAFDIGSMTMALRNIFVVGAVRTGVKAGLPVDADVDTPTDGMLLVDTATQKLYFRSSAVWRQAGVVPSQQGPVLGLGFDQGSSDVYLVREAANELAQRNGTSAQVFRVYKSYTTDSNYERLALGYVGGNGVLETQRAGSGGNSPLIVSAETLYLRTSTLGIGWFIDNSASIAPESNNVRDIGRSANRVRDLYLGTRLIVGTSATPPIIRSPANSATSISIESPEFIAFLSGKSQGGVNGNALWDGSAWARWDTSVGSSHLSVGQGSINMYTVPAGTGTPPWANRLSIDSAGLVRISGKLNVGSAAAASQDGDVSSSRNSAPTSGTYYFGNTPSKYLHYDGSNFSLVGGNLTVSGYLTSSGANLGAATITTLSASNKLNVSLATGGIGTSAASEGQIEIQNAGSGAAKITFHRTGAYAAYLGLDTDNQWAVGGWSMGAARYVLITDTQSQTMSNKRHSGHFYIDGGYLFGSYVNLTADVAGGSPVYIAGQNGDNYLRWWPKSVISPPADGAVDDANHYVAASLSGTWGNADFAQVYNGGINIPKAGHWIVGCMVTVTFNNGPGGPGIYGAFHIRGTAGHAHYDQTFKPAPDCDHNPGLSTGFGWMWHGHLNPGNVLLYTDTWIYRNSNVTGTMWGQFVGTQSYPN